MTLWLFLRPHCNFGPSPNTTLGQDCVGALFWVLCRAAALVGLQKKGAVSGDTWALQTTPCP